MSPRAGGNSDAAADLLADLVSGAVLRLRDFGVLPCTGCGACACIGRCVLADEDRAEELFERVAAAPGLILTAPVYFYHLPAQAKAWIDRGQSRYLAREKGLRPRGPRRRAHAVLLAGRPRGERLFEGILPTLRYFLDVLDFDLVDTALARGVDAPGDILVNTEARRAVRELGQRISW
jgi:hypothetical protein